MCTHAQQIDINYRIHGKLQHACDRVLGGSKYGVRDLRQVGGVARVGGCVGGWVGGRVGARDNIIEPTGSTMNKHRKKTWPPQVSIFWGVQWRSFGVLFYKRKLSRASCSRPRIPEKLQGAKQTLATIADGTFIQPFRHVPRNSNKILTVESLTYWVIRIQYRNTTVHLFVRILFDGTVRWAGGGVGAPPLKRYDGHRSGGAETGLASKRKCETAHPACLESAGKVFLRV